MDSQLETQELYFAAYLTDFKKNVLIPDHWCDTFDLAVSINDGLNKNQNHLIFVSPDLNKVPDFSLPVRKALDLTTDGCYFGKLLRAFSKYALLNSINIIYEYPKTLRNIDQFTDTQAEAVHYVEKRRQIIPAVYNLARSEGRSKEETKLLSSKEYNNALGSGFTALNARFEVKKEKFCDEVSELRKRICEYNSKGIHEAADLDDSDLEFLQDEVEESDSDIEFEALLPKPVEVAVKIEDADQPDEFGQLNYSSQSDQNEVNENVSSTSADNPVIVQADEVNNESDENINALSGSIAFDTNDVNDHFYPEYNAAIRSSIIKCLVAWNSTFPFNTSIYDKRFVGVLLKELFGARYAQNEVDEKRISFIKRLFQIRVKDDVNRFEAFDAIVKEKQDKAKEKLNKNRLS